MRSLTLGLIRHGETDWNVQSRLQGTSDIPLNENGIRQAVAAARAIDGSEWDLVISSPLSRARDTARIISDANALGEVEIEQLLLERAFGEAEGLNYHDWKLTHDPRQGIPGGESLVELEARARRCLEVFAERYASKRVLAVSHGAFIRKLVRIASNKQLPLEGDRFANTSLTKLVFDGDQWTVSYYNPVSLSV